MDDPSVKHKFCEGGLHPSGRGRFPSPGCEFARWTNGCRGRVRIVRASVDPPSGPYGRIKDWVSNEIHCDWIPFYSLRTHESLRHGLMGNFGPATATRTKGIQNRSVSSPRTLRGFTQQTLKLGRKDPSDKGVSARTPRPSFPRPVTAGFMSSPTSSGKTPERVTFSYLTPNNLGVVRKLNSVLFPVKYAEKYYKEILAPEVEEFCQLGERVPSITSGKSVLAPPPYGWI